MSVTVRLPAMPAPVGLLWHALLDLDEATTVRWCLVGGQMVLLHAIEHGQVPPQISQDGDVVADVRTDPTALVAVVEVLHALGFTLAGFSADGLAHRYVLEAQPAPVVVDVLAPDGLGGRADLTTTPPGRTLEMPGGTQALDRRELVTVVHDGRTGTVHRPSLLAAIVAKSAATTLADPARHYRDLALLCALVVDPFTLVDELTKKDRAHLRSAKALTEDRHPAWLLMPAGLRTQGQIALALLTRPEQ